MANTDVHTSFGFEGGLSWQGSLVKIHIFIRRVTLPEFLLSILDNEGGGVSGMRQAGVEHLLTTVRLRKTGMEYFLTVLGEAGVKHLIATVCGLNVHILIVLGKRVYICVNVIVFVHVLA